MKKKAPISSQPPSPPPFPRKVQFHRVQMIGMPLLMVVPLLALFGFFGESSTTTQTQNDRLRVQVTYTTRSRYKIASPVEVTVYNRSTTALATVEVRFAKAYIDQFADVVFTPQVTAITDQEYIVQLHDLPPEVTRVVTVNLQGERYGRHEGGITVSEASAPTNGLALPITTWIFP